MRIKTLLCGTLASLMVLCCAIDADAQKKSTGKRTTSSKPAAKTATAAQPAGPAIAPDYLTGRNYSLYQKFATENIYMYSDVDFEQGNDITIDRGYTKSGGDWKVSGNKVTITSGNRTYSLASDNGGLSFKGTTAKTGGTSYVAEMYSTGCRNLTDRADKDLWLKALKSGEYTAWIRYYIIKEKMYFADPVKVKFVEDEDDPYVGTVKITGEGDLMEFLGSLKSKYEFGENGLTIHFTDVTPDENSTSKYKENCGGYFWVKLGAKQIPGYGKAVVLLDFYHK